MGDMFDLINSNDSLHLKAYKVTKVNTTTNKFSFPGLQRSCAQVILLQQVLLVLVFAQE